MIIEPPEEKILAKLKAQGDGCWVAGELRGFSSGAGVMKAIRSLEAKELVDFRDGEVCLTDKGRDEIDHASGRLRRRIAKRVAVPRWVTTAVIALLTFILGFLADNLAPEVYCPIMPDVLADALTPCISSKAP